MCGATQWLWRRCCSGMMVKRWRGRGWGCTGACTQAGKEWGCASAKTSTHSCSVVTMLESGHGAAVAAAAAAADVDVDDDEDIHEDDARATSRSLWVVQCMHARIQGPWGCLYAAPRHVSQCHGNAPVGVSVLLRCDLWRPPLPVPLQS